MVIIVKNGTIGSDSVRSREATEVLEGLIEPYMVVNVGSPVPGILETIKVDRGDMVKKGQVLATLKSGVERATMQLTRVRAEMKSAIRAREARLKFIDDELDVTCGAGARASDTGAPPSAT